MYMNVMFEKMPGSSVQSYLYKVLTLLSMPSYVNAYKFLVDTTKHLKRDCVSRGRLDKDLDLLHVVHEQRLASPSAKSQN